MSNLFKYMYELVDEDAEASALKASEELSAEIYNESVATKEGYDNLIANMKYSTPKGNVTVTCEYWIEDGQVACDKDTEDICNEIVTFVNTGEVAKTFNYDDNSVTASTNIFAADDDMDSEDAEFDRGPDMFADDDIGISNQLDDIADTVEDLQDTVDDAVEEDDIDIAMDNNIENHYIAECDKCKGIFISSVIKSDQTLDKISGTCPLCNKESDQYLKWVVSAIE